jgi:hypothetical protein
MNIKGIEFRSVSIVETLEGVNEKFIFHVVYGERKFSFFLDILN